jgi:hypothetical protein
MNGLRHFEGGRKPSTAAAEPFNIKDYQNVVDKIARVTSSLTIARYSSRSRGVIVDFMGLS